MQLFKQECIPVGCVPPAPMTISGGGRVSTGGVSAREGCLPCEENDRQTGVKTLRSHNFVCGWLKCSYTYVLCMLSADYRRGSTEFPLICPVKFPDFLRVFPDFFLVSPRHFSQKNIFILFKCGLSDISLCKYCNFLTAPEV